MSYDEAYLPGLEELKELPQWTGAGPVVPYIKGEEMLEKLDLNNAKMSFVISGSSVESVTGATEDANASLTCHVEIPVNVEIPETIPGGKLLWFYKEMPWKDIATNENKVIFTVQYDSLSTILNENYQRGEKVKFCYESAGGSHVNDLELSDNILDNSKIVIEPYSKAVLQKCLDELKGASDTKEPVLRQYEIQGLVAVKPDDTYNDPRVQPKTVDAYSSIKGTDLTEMPKDWQLQNP